MMVQRKLWRKGQIFKKFVNWMQLCIAFEKSGGLYLEEPGLTAGRLGGWLTRLARLEILKACCISKYSIFGFV